MFSQRGSGRDALRWAATCFAARPAISELTDDAAVVAGPDHHATGFDLRADLRAALGALPQQQARCWVLRELGGYTYADIAERLGIPESTVRGSLAAARKSILARMGGHR